jgi:hypothetical protein
VIQQHTPTELCKKSLTPAEFKSWLGLFAFSALLAAACATLCAHRSRLTQLTV